MAAGENLLRYDFDDRASLAKQLAEAVARNIETMQIATGVAAIAVSGGTTPARFFAELGKHRELDWTKVYVTLVDERWVDETSDRSNAMLVNEKMLQGPAAVAHFIPLYAGGAEPDDAMPQAAPLAPAGSLADVPQLAERTADAGVRVHVTWRGEQRPLPPEIELSAFRIIQESVTNVVRHSGARTCRVAVGYEPKEVTIEVVDDGDDGLGGPGRPRHSTAGGSGFGLLGMRERVTLLSGQFSAGRRPEGGFRVAARLPA